MKMWKENRLNQEWELSNREIAERFAKSKYDKTAKDLVYFITTKNGLNSSFDFDEKKGSVDGCPEIKEIMDIVWNELIEDK